MEEKKWPEFLKVVQDIDDRDLPDAARWYADAEADVVARPENDGEWKASMETAFYAGMLWAKMKPRN